MKAVEVRWMDTGQIERAGIGSELRRESTADQILCNNITLKFVL